MNKIIILLIVILFALMHAAVSVAVINPDGPIARRALSNEVLSLIQKKEFNKLENMARRFREGKERFPDGVWKLPYFYEGISEAEFMSDQQWLDLIKLIEQWERQFPHSPTAKLSLATAWMGYAQRARWDRIEVTQGNKVQNKQGDKSLFKEGLKHIQKIMSNKDLLHKCPHFYVLNLQLALLMGASREEFEHLFKEAISFEPRYITYYAVVITYYGENWYGKTREWVQQLNRFDTMAPRGEGVYARLAYGLMPNAWKSFDEGTVSWDKMKRSFDELPQNSPWVLNMKAAYAYRADDLATARSLLEKIGAAPYYEAWRGRYDNCREMVKLPRLSSFNDSMEYRYLTFLSEHGNEWAKTNLKWNMMGSRVGYPHK